ncbi:MAG: hypothetical protein ACW99F_04930 [Candidatus Hodarchaeales archaeon]|jgi:hypothetical protein
MSPYCANCGFRNEADSKFCAQCGFQVDSVPVTPIRSAPISSSPKSIQFSSSSHNRRHSYRPCRSAPRRQVSGWVLGAVFLTAGLIFAIIILAPLASGGHYAPHSTWSDFGDEMGELGSEIGDFFGDFGDEMGDLGSDIGDSYNHPSSHMGSSIGRVLFFCLLAFFFLSGILLIVFATRASHRPS